TALQAHAGAAPRRCVRARDDDERARSLARRAGCRCCDRPRSAVPARNGRLPDPLAGVRCADPGGDPACRAHDARGARREGRAGRQLMGRWERLRGLELRVEGMQTERRSLEVSSDFTRVSTVVVLSGGGEEGRGEDVTYNVEDHDWFPAVKPAGATT